MVQPHVRERMSRSAVFHEVADRELPKSVVTFITAYVDHIVKLQFLLFLHHSLGGSTIKVAARELDVSKQQISDMAYELACDGLVRIGVNEIELVPRSIEDRLAIAELAGAYSRDRRTVMDLLRSMGRLAS